MNDRKGVAVASVADAIEVFDKSAERTTPNAQTEAWTVIRKHITDYAALQRRVDALEALLRECVDKREGLAYEYQLLDRIRALLSGDGECGTEEAG